MEVKAEKKKKENMHIVKSVQTKRPGPHSLFLSSPADNSKGQKPPRGTFGWTGPTGCVFCLLPFSRITGRFNQD